MTFSFKVVKERLFKMAGRRSRSRSHRSHRRASKAVLTQHTVLKETEQAAGEELRKLLDTSFQVMEPLNAVARPLVVKTEIIIFKVDENMPHLGLLSIFLAMNDPQFSDPKMSFNLYLSYILEADSGSNALRHKLEQHGYTLGTASEAAWTLIEDRVAQIKNEIIATIGEFDSRFIYALNALLILVCTKQLNGDNYNPWVKARVKGVIAKVGIPEHMELLIGLMPKVGFCSIVYAKIPAVWQFQAGLFLASWLMQCNIGRLGSLSSTLPRRW